MRRSVTFKMSAIIVVILISVASSCKSSNPPTPTPLKVGIDRFVGFAPIYLASERNIYKDLGIEVEPQMVIDTVARNSSFASGRSDAICTTADSLLLAADKGMDLVIIGAVDESLGADGIVARPDIQSISDLKNKTVAFQEAMPSHFFILWLLDKNGMSKSDILAVSMNADEAGAAFMAGKLDAAVTWEPWLSKAVESGKGRLLTSTRDHPGVLIDVLAVRRDVLERRERDVIALYKGWMRAIELAHNDPEGSNLLMSQKIGIELNDFRTQLGTVKLADQAFNEQFFKKENPESIWNLATQAISLWKKAGVIDPNDKFDPSKHITDRIVMLASKN
jgi:NitT/TauT family transport system substrate-binding protein